MNFDFTLKDCFFGGIKLAKIADPYKYMYSGYGIGFDSRSLFPLPNFDWDKNVIIFGVDVSWSVHTENKKKDTLILGNGPAQRLHDTTLTAEAQYSINFSKSNRRFCLSLHYNKSISFLFVKTTEIYFNSKQKILK